MLLLFGIVMIAKTALSRVDSKIIGIVFSIFAIYMLMVQAHLLGRFYYHNAEKLNWEV